jgi:hypothetical protein
MNCIGPDEKTFWEVTGLHVRVTRGKHGRESGDLLLATAAFAGLLEVTAITNCAQCSLAVEFLLQSSQYFFDGLAFF